MKPFILFFFCFLLKVEAMFFVHVDILEQNWYSKTTECFYF